ncbi:HET-domain-containing protein [Pleurostoma richardsiae]|uniref:HET-domain-containing protein n=1 Tax=Pleurostoma richardsiae TaxID=41990 RepID=A0AA38RJZ2_9PEZI|nr:HET-domain-containing protein [Pleurostoma richardsiae]
MDLKLEQFAAWPETEDVPLDTYFGTTGEMLKRSNYCVLCRLITQHISREEEYPKKDIDVIGCWIRDGQMVPDDQGSGSAPGRTTTLRLRVVPWVPRGVPEPFARFDIVPLVDPDVSPPQLFFGRRADSGQLDLEQVRQWIRNCTEWHGEKCKPPGWTASSKGTRFGPFLRLLDLESNCLIETPRPNDYLCLSYVWGSGPVFKTLKNNLSRMKTPGSLESLFKRFPKSIRDGITVTRALGYSLLWIDSLCIVQDDEYDKATQISLMGEIYQSAAVTLVIAGGDSADAGIKGLIPGSRKLEQITAKCSENLTLVKLLPDCDQIVRGSVWNTRGWTYQERLLSTRCLFFLGDTVYFQCPMTTWGEDYHAEHPRMATCAPMQTYNLSLSWQPTEVQRSAQYRLHTHQTPYFKEYCRLVEEYTSRSMTFASDRIRGIASLFATLRSVFGCSFLYGLQEQMFLESLLWQPAARLRRVPNDPKKNRPLFPSWSWAGWIGTVEYLPASDFNGLEPLREHWRRSQPIPAAQLRIQDLARGILQTPRVPEYERPMLLAKMWSEVETARDGIIYVEEGKTDIFHSTPPRVKPIYMFQEDPYGIRVKSKIAKFCLSIQDRTDRPEPAGRPFIRLGITSSGRSTNGQDEDPWLGGIRLPGDFWRRTRKSRDDLFEPVEFVLLSEAYGFGPDELSPQAAGKLQPYAVYNVMLVKRVTQNIVSDTSAVIVERQGVGKVLKTAWDAADGIEEEVLIV